MVEMYVAEQQAFQQDTYRRQVEAFNETRTAWNEEFANDPEIGKNRRDTTLARCGSVMKAYQQAVGDEKFQGLVNALRITGAGDHPEFIRFINHFARFTAEATKPVAAVVPKAPGQTGSARARAYQRSANQGNGAA